MPSECKPIETKSEAQKKCDDFNEILEGSMFKYWPLRDIENEFAEIAWLYARTIGQAFVSADGRAVVFITDHDDYVPCGNLDFIK